MPNSPGYLANLNPQHRRRIRRPHHHIPQLPIPLLRIHVPLDLTSSAAYPLVLNLPPIALLVHPPHLRLEVRCRDAEGALVRAVQAHRHGLVGRACRQAELAPDGRGQHGQIERAVRGGARDDEEATAAMTRGEEVQLRSDAAMSAEVSKQSRK